MGQEKHVSEKRRLKLH